MAAGHLYAEPFALSADTLAILKGMGHTVVVPSPWGAEELIATAGATKGREAATSGNDASRTGGCGGAMLYGANDNRRPAGAAIGH